MHGATRREPPRMMGAAGQSALLVASVVAMTSICKLVLEAEAGGKGKGHRQGHIIIQNELKGNSVPIYMPIPIPIPMPVAQHAKFGHHDQQQQHHHQNEDDSEGEVKKIYLLQPVPMQRPQPNLKGGGFMGPPVQNHIHVGHMPMSPAKHRSGGGGDKHYHHQPIQQQHHHHHHSESSQQTKSSSEVKVLPIVVIPPMAPVPPIQVNPSSNQVSSHAPRMTLTPHFNNYVVTSSAGTRDRNRHGPRQTSLGTAYMENVSEYGGSLGGSVFREQFAARSRPGGRVRTRTTVSGLQGDDFGLPSQRRGTRQSTRDYDYNDYDAPEPGGGLRGSSTGGAGGSLADWDRSEDQWPPPLRVAHRPGGRQYRRSGSSPMPVRAQQRARVTMNSINEIIDAYNRQQDSDELDLGPGERAPAEFTAAQLRLTRVHQRPQTDMLDYKAASQRQSVSLPPSSMEISLDELASMGRDMRRTERQLQQQVRAEPDLSSLYYDRAESLDDYVGSSSRASAPVEDRAALYEDDEWRFDSIKSVRHEAPEKEEATKSERGLELKPPDRQGSVNANSTSVPSTRIEQQKRFSTSTLTANHQTSERKETIATNSNKLAGV